MADLVQEGRGYIGLSEASAQVHPFDRGGTDGIFPLESDVQEEILPPVGNWASVLSPKAP
jgi:hypothetical protein